MRMRLNKNTKIIGTNVILVPYKKHHVSKYHGWMQSEELRILTASEPLSLQEEYNMQQSWLIDENKCTFIVLDKENYAVTNNEVESMIGDTNLFFADPDDRFCAEAEIMIAENISRGKKRGFEAMLHMLLYGVNNINVKHYIVKILEFNKISINMFLKLGFKQIAEKNVFNEITFEKVVDCLWLDWIKEQLPVHQIVNEYDKF